MPNIMLTYRCNLHCSYCFANEFVNRDKTDITMENFLKALSFITREGKAQIGLIGGEPTLHPGFPVILELMAANPSVKSFTVYTNGLLLDRFVPQLSHPKAHILVNCNSPRVIGEEAYARMRGNLDMLAENSAVKDRIRLGINLYSDGMDYSYILELLQRYDMHRVRISTTVPDFSAGAEYNAMDYFRKRTAFLMRFFRDLDGIRVLPVFDCNRPPDCIWTDGEREWLKAYAARYPGQETNLINGHSKCEPVIDILPSLQAVRCFGMSDFTKVPIEDFRCLSDLSAYFVNEIDAAAYKLPACEACRECYERRTRKCVPGCMGFKAGRIRACNEAAERL